MGKQRPEDLTEGQREFFRIEEKYNPKLAPFLGKSLQPGSQEYADYHKIMARRDAEIREWQKKYLAEPPKQYTSVEEILAPPPELSFQEWYERVGDFLDRFPTAMMWARAAKIMLTMKDPDIQEKRDELRSEQFKLYEKNPAFPPPPPLVEPADPWTDIQNMRSWGGNVQKQTEAKQPGNGGKNRQPKTKGWKPPNGYIGSKEIVNNRNVPRTTLQVWQERDKLKVKKDPQTQENYYPKNWFEKHLKNYKPRGRET